MSQGCWPRPCPPTSQEQASLASSLSLSHQKTLLGLTGAWPAQPGAGTTPVQTILVVMS